LRRDFGRALFQKDEEETAYRQLHENDHGQQAEDSHVHPLRHFRVRFAKARRAGQGRLRQEHSAEGEAGDQYPHDTLSVHR
jgi:hypothetical protein